MPNPSKGIRLWLKPASQGRKAVWLIRDGDKQVSTGCGNSDRDEAQKRLADYINEKYRSPRERGREPSSISIADVLNIYAEDRGHAVVRPAEYGQRMLALLQFFGSRNLDTINGAVCREYASQRRSDSMARRELEDLRAAINHHRKEGLCNAIVEIVLPPRSMPRERWLTRSEAARMIWAAWRYREVQNGKPTERRSRRHIARFILVGLYTGTRSGAICGAAIRTAINRGYVDLVEGVFYRKAPRRPKTKKRQPTIRIPARLLAHLRRWERLGISKTSVVEFAGKSVKSVKKAFAAVARDANVPNVTPHVLRHTAVSWAMQNGADPYDASDFFGMTLEVLQDVYAHHHPDHQRGVGEAITRRTGSLQVERNKR
jgi:integrase